MFVLNKLFIDDVEFMETIYGLGMAYGCRTRRRVYILPLFVQISAGFGGISVSATTLHVSPGLHRPRPALLASRP